MEKALLPYQVAKALDNLKFKNDGERTLYNFPNIALHANKNPDYRIINEYLNLSDSNFKNYYIALSIGYEAEKTPEEKVKERYEFYRANNMNVSANAIQETLTLLEIKIEGI